MHKISAEDVMSTARRAGWSISPERAAQIAATAAPRLESFERVRATLGFEDEPAGFTAALLAAGPGTVGQR